jgi:threonine dehydrogenase-like Zn-dependent dehydrogenase
VPGQEVQPATARPDRRRQGHPSFIVSHELSLEQGADAYSHFDARDDGWTKVVLKPALGNA